MKTTKMMSKLIITMVSLLLLCPGMVFAETLDELSLQEDGAEIFEEDKLTGDLDPDAEDLPIDDDYRPANIYMGDDYTGEIVNTKTISIPVMERTDFIAALTVDVEPDDITFKSSDEKIVKVLQTESDKGDGIFHLTGVCPGTARIIVQGAGLTTSFFVDVTADIAKAEITGIKDKICTGKEITQSPTVKVNGFELTPDKDYTVSYKNNIKAGKATMTFTGTNKYCIGSKSVTFNILQGDQKITAKDYIELRIDDERIEATTDGDGKLTFVSGDTNILTFDADGNIIVKGYGRTTVTITAAETPNFKAATKTVNVKVGYAITYESNPDGKGTIDSSHPYIALPGETVTVTGTPADKWQFSEWRGVTYREIPFVDKNSATTTFKMPAKHLLIEAVFKPIPESIDNAKVTLSRTSYVYDGKVKKPKIRSVGGNKVKENSDVYVKIKDSNNATCKKPINAGKYYVYVSGADYFYSGTAKKATYKITKAANELNVTAKKKTIKVDYSKLKEKKQKISKNSIFTFKNKKKTTGKLSFLIKSITKDGKKIKSGFTLAKSSGYLKINQDVEKGTYKFTVKVSSGDSNHVKVSQTVKFNVSIE